MVSHTHTMNIIKRFFEWLYFSKSSFEAGAFCKRKIIKISGIGWGHITFRVAVFPGAYKYSLCRESVIKYFPWCSYKPNIT